jgi:hypothetical protein
MSVVFPQDVRDNLFLAITFCRPLGEVVAQILRKVKAADLSELMATGKNFDEALAGNFGEGVLLESVRVKLLKEAKERGEGKGVVV